MRISLAPMRPRDQKTRRLLLKWESQSRTLRQQFLHVLEMHQPQQTPLGEQAERMPTTIPQRVRALVHLHLMEAAVVVRVRGQVMERRAGGPERAKMHFQELRSWA